jgi:hypothetical protein
LLGDQMVASTACGSKPTLLVVSKVAAQSMHAGRHSCIGAHIIGLPTELGNATLPTELGQSRGTGEHSARGWLALSAALP